MADSPPPNAAPRNDYWRAVIRFTVILLVIWALVSLGAAILFVEPLNRLNIGRLPAGFWMAQQGSIVVFVVLIFVYARRMDRLDHTFKKDEQP
jgi:putative solute:sodium symporter small subunit